jgi:hypothetical protein
MIKVERQYLVKMLYSCCIKNTGPLSFVFNLFSHKR